MSGSRPPGGHVNSMGDSPCTTETVNYCLSVKGKTMNEKAKSPGLDWIQLVRTRATGFVALLVRTAMIAEAVESGAEPDEPPVKGKAKRKKLAPAALPEKIRGRLDKVKAATGVLSAALAARNPGTLAADPARAAADKAIDESIRALDEVLLAFTKIPVKKARAEKAHVAFFRGEGNEWLNADFDTQWADVKSRLDHIDSNGVAAMIHEIGGKDVLDHLRDMFKAYGAALGITSKTVEASAVDVKTPYLEAIDALRRYVAVVIAHGAESDVDPAAGELAEALLAPIEAMRTKNAQRRASKPGAGDDGGEPGDGDDPMDPTEPTKPGDDDGND